MRVLQGATGFLICMTPLRIVLLSAISKKMKRRPHSQSNKAFPSGSEVKNPFANAGDPPDLSPGLGRCPEEGHGNPLQYSCLENPMDRGAWRAIVHGVTKNWMWVATEQQSNQ